MPLHWAWSRKRACGGAARVITFSMCARRSSKPPFASGASNTTYVTCFHSSLPAPGRRRTDARRLGVVAEIRAQMLARARVDGLALVLPRRARAHVHAALTRQRVRRRRALHVDGVAVFERGRVRGFVVVAHRGRI